MLHNAPSQPSLQMHWNAFTLSTQVPPFSHKLILQSLMSTKNKTKNALKTKRRRVKCKTKAFKLYSQLTFMAIFPCVAGLTGATITEADLMDAMSVFAAHTRHRYRTATYWYHCATFVALKKRKQKRRKKSLKLTMNRPSRDNHSIYSTVS